MDCGTGNVFEFLQRIYKRSSSVDVSTEAVTIITPKSIIGIVLGERSPIDFCALAVKHGVDLRHDPVDLRNGFSDVRDGIDEVLTLQTMRQVYAVTSRRRHTSRFLFSQSRTSNSVD
jgi:hypothetical protein